ncbi:hypothetical protein EDB85DRAFT_1888585 [Lactarius pseudohatsudake]|nr:hypothetical protein EDB85DRAFT_1888585 [Lactarius pseudohatsudake]
MGARRSRAHAPFARKQGWGVKRPLPVPAQTEAGRKGRGQSSFVYPVQQEWGRTAGKGGGPREEAEGGLREGSCSVRRRGELRPTTQPTGHAERGGIKEGTGGGAH